MTIDMKFNIDIWGGYIDFNSSYGFRILTSILSIFFFAIVCRTDKRIIHERLDKILQNEEFDEEQ
jgi:hypothetical protein